MSSNALGTAFGTVARETGTVRVVIAEDEHLVRYAMRAILDADPGIEVVGEAGDGAEAVSVANSTRPDVVLMDVRMPVVDGIAATRQLLRTLPDTRVVMMTSVRDEDIAMRAMTTGAVGYLLKASNPGSLRNAVRLAAEGEAVLSGGIGRMLVARASDSAEARQCAARNRLAGLSARERDVLRLMAKGLANTEIAGQLGTSRASVKTYVARLLRKLGLENRTQAAVLATDAGLLAS